MHHESIIALLDTMGDAKTNQKKVLLKDFSADHLTILKRMLNPFERFGVRQFPYVPSCDAPTATDDDINTLLDDLCFRRIGGSLARERLAEVWAMCTDNQREAIKRTCLKDPKAGIGITLVNSVHKKLVPCLKVALAEKYSPESFTGRRLVSPKLDGMRIICRCDMVNRTVEWMSREGNPVTTMDHLNEVALDYAASLCAVIANEADMGVVFLDGEGTAGGFNDTVSNLRKKNTKAANANYSVFDFFSLKSMKSCKAIEVSWTQERRQQMLDDAQERWEASGSHNAAIKTLKGKIVETDAEVQAIYKLLRTNGVEGVIVKDLTALYPFKRNKCWSKIKDQIDADGKIIGYERGDENKQYKDTLGAIVVELESGVVVKVSSGLTLQNREDIWNNQDKYNGRVIELLGHEYTPDGSIRHPRLANFPHCLRDSEAFVGDKM